MVTEIFRKIMRKESIKPLGRWKLEYNHIIMNNKVDLSNEDHCGPCGQYAINHFNKIESSETNEINKKEI